MIKYPPAKPEALWLRASQRGLLATKFSQSRQRLRARQRSVHVANGHWIFNRPPSASAITDSVSDDVGLALFRQRVRDLAQFTSKK